MKTMIALLLLAAPLAAQDVVRFKNPVKNPEVEGDVVSMSAKTVEVEVVVDGVRIKRAFDSREIAELVPRKSVDFLKAEEAIGNGDFNAAVQRFERVAADARAGELLRQAASIQIVRTHAAAGNPAAVLQSSRALRARKGDGYYVGESCQAEVEAQLSTGDLKQAGETVKAFLALANAQGVPDWVRSAELLGALVSEGQNQWAIALTVYRKHGRDAEVADEVARGEMRCLTAIGDWPALRRRAEAVIKDSITRRNVESRTLIAAYTGKGDLDMNDGRQKEALLNYLQGAIVLNRGEKSAEHEAALARSSLTCTKLAAAEKDRDAKAVHRGRAQELFRDLASIYPKSALRAPVEKAIQETR